LRLKEANNRIQKTGYSVALFVGQIQPGTKQLLRLAFLHRGKVHALEQSPPVEVTSKQGIGHLPEKAFGRIVPSHFRLLPLIKDSTGHYSTLHSCPKTVFSLDSI